MSHRLATGHGARRRRGAARFVALLAVLSLVAGACSRGDDDVATGGDASSTTAPPDGTNAGDGEKGPGDFGDLKDVCGPAEGDNADDTAQGVTERGDPDRHDLRSRVRRPPRPEPGAVRRQPTCSRSGATRPAASTAARSSVNERDAKLTEYKQRITEACAEDFFLVGGGAVFDDTGQEERLNCLLPDVPGLRRSPRRPGAPTSRRQPLPERRSTRCRSASTSTSTRSSRTRSSKVGFMTGNVPATVTVDKQNQEGVKTLGWDVVYQTQYNAAGEASWTPFAQAMQEQRASRASSTPASPRTRPSCSRPSTTSGYELDWVVGRRQPPRRQAHRGRRAPRSRTCTCARRVVPPFAGRREPGHPAVPRPVREVPAGRQVQGAASATTRSRPGCSSPRPPRSAAPTSPASACTTTPSRSRSGPAAACTPPAIPSSTQGPGCGMVVEATPDGFVVPDDFELTDGLFHCDDDNVVQAQG